MKERRSRAVWICAVILCALMAVIFLLSAQPASESAQSSGRIVDFVIDYNQREEDREERRKKASEEPQRRRATQADIDSFFGA